MLNLADLPLSHCRHIPHIPRIPGGSSRSAVKEVAPESRAKQALEYKVPQVSFQNALEKHTVVKMDCEGSEIPILLTEWDWKDVRLLVVEISVRKLRMDHPKGDGWKVLDQIFENLKKAGFQYARVEKRFFIPGYWDPESGNRNYMSDGIIWFLRPKGPVEFKDSERELYSHWLQYKRIMEAGGEVENAAKPLVVAPTPEKKSLNVEEQTLMEHATRLHLLRCGSECEGCQRYVTVMCFHVKTSSYFLLVCMEYDL